MPKPKLLGLILDGGESSRMGQDKGAIVYHKLSPLEQTERHLRSLKSLGISSYISSGPTGFRDSSHIHIPDQKDMRGGPGAGILSAHLFDPSAAWLVIACDFPFIDMKAIEDLIYHRKGSGISTAYRHLDGTLEPLFAIWEPETLSEFLKQFKMGEKSPRAILERTQALTMTPENLKTLININSPLEAQVYPELHH